jgi:4,5-dihydroxyphthalate decarboxylase
VRDLHHDATQVLRAGPIRRATDLAGGRVGVNRGYTVTTGVWGRAALAEQGLDLAGVTWVVSGDEHVSSFVRPANVVPANGSLTELLLAGELDAVVGADIDHPDVVALLPVDEGWRSLREQGLFPINHLLVVRDDLLATEPGLATAVFEAFAESKRRYVHRLAAGDISTKQDRLLSRVMSETGADPLPFGVAANQLTLEALMTHAVAQGILTRPFRPQEIFAPSTLTLTG